MEPTITWLDLTASDRDEMRRVLALFGEEGSIDELGLGRIRDALAAKLFPGVTSIQTRLRYVLFVPWIYLELERRRCKTDQVAEKARKAEIKLIKALDKNSSEEDWGIIGVRAREDLRRLPSSVYWRCCITWRIFGHDKGQNWYHTHFSSLRQGNPNWHRRLPDAPDDFPKDASFAMTAEEADFVRGRLQEGCPGTLLAWLADRPQRKYADSLWEEPASLGADGRVGALVELARRFSLHVEGLPILYNLMLAEKHHEFFGNAEESWVDGYRDSWQSWAERESREAPFDGSTLWSACIGHHMPALLQSFVDAWTSRLAEIDIVAAADDKELRRLIRLREERLKGPKARLKNPAKRLLHWRGRSGVGRMHFNWLTASTMLEDLHEALS